MRQEPIAAVTGASRGIGRATAALLAERGYRVFALARTETDLQQLAAEHPHRIVPLPLDITDPVSRARAVEGIMTQTDGYGLDLLVNNAGYGLLGPLEEVSLDAMHHQFEVNVFGLLAFTQPFLPGMRTRRRGTIVNISSAAGQMATPFMGAYAASKHALEGLSDSLRVELARYGVRVVLIQPGPIRHTDFGRAADRRAVRNPASPYAQAARSFGGASRGVNLLSRSPRAVARLVLRAAEAERPRPRYRITLPSHAAGLARRVLPDWVVDLALRLAA